MAFAFLIIRTVGGWLQLKKSNLFGSPHDFEPFLVEILQCTKNKVHCCPVNVFSGPFLT